MLSIQILRAAHRHQFGRNDLLEDIDFRNSGPLREVRRRRLRPDAKHESIVGAAAAVNFIASTRNRPDPP